MPDSKPLRVLFLTRYPVAGASSRYRVYQYLPHLRALGVHCEVQPFMDEAMYALSFSPGRTLRKVWHTLLAVVRRVGAVRRHRGFHVVYMQRELLPFGPPLLERWLKRDGAHLVFDYDDALFIAKASRYNPLATLLRAPAKVFEIFAMVDLVVAGNDWLRDQAIAHGGRAVTVEVAEDTTRFAPKNFGRGPEVVIGWLGSTSTVKYLHLIEPVLREVARRYPHVRFELMGGGEFEMAGVPWRLLPWSLQGEVDALGRWHIGLMPLPDEAWANGKSGGKARTYMAAGVVPVCTAIGYNLELLEHRRTGMLCRTSDEWLDALCRLVEDEPLRELLSRNACADVVERFSPAQQALKLRDALLSTLGASDKATQEREAR
jgi:glycosyltransferase involved in cell wall biosynthesis